MKAFLQKASWLAGSLVVVTLVGCIHPQGRSSVQSDQGTAGVAPSKSAPPKSGCAEATDGLIHLAKRMPAEATLGSEFVTGLTIVAQSCAANVVVRDTIPVGASYIRSAPAATVEGTQLVWKLGNLDAGQSVKSQVWLKADKEGTLTSCATVTADPRVCAQTMVGKPVLSIAQSGPETAVLSSELTFNLVIKNSGTAAARNVVVTNPVPAGLSQSSGKNEVRFDVGDLAPGQSKSVAVTFKANQRGKICTIATATSSNADTVSAETCTVILVPGLKVEKSGIKEQILGRNADFEIVVTNTGDTTLKNVIVTETTPEGTTIVAAPGARIESNKATWTIAELKPGAKATKSLKLTSKVAGTHCIAVTASSGQLNDTAKACTLWRGIPAVALDVRDEPDPIQVGESTTYTITVSNQGFAAINNLKIVANFDVEVSPVTSPEGTVNGRKVTFPVVAKLAAKQALSYTIAVKGVRAGDSRNTIILTADELKTPVQAEESTTVY